jgi:GNAT superfamily N-acetyltransferase
MVKRDLRNYKSLSLKSITARHIEGTNITLLVDTVYRNFINLSHVRHLKHTPYEINRILRSPRMYSFFMYDGKFMIGYLLGEIMKLHDGRTVYYVSYLYISESYRGTGLGSKLLSFAVNKVKGLGVNTIMLTADTENQAVYDFYLKKGFMLDPVLRRYERYDVLSRSL